MKEREGKVQIRLWREGHKDRYRYQRVQTDPSDSARVKPIEGGKGRRFTISYASVRRVREFLYERHRSFTYRPLWINFGIVANED